MADKEAQPEKLQKKDSGSVRHCASALSVCVTAGRDMLSTFFPSVPPSRYNVPCVMAADIRQQLTGIDVGESHWLTAVLLFGLVV